MIVRPSWLGAGSSANSGELSRILRRLLRPLPPRDDTLACRTMPHRDDLHMSEHGLRVPKRHYRWPVRLRTPTGTTRHLPTPETPTMRCDPALLGPLTDAEAATVGVLPPASSTAPPLPQHTHGSHAVIHRIVTHGLRGGRWYLAAAAPLHPDTSTTSSTSSCSCCLSSCAWAGLAAAVEAIGEEMEEEAAGGRLTWDPGQAGKQRNETAVGCETCGGCLESRQTRTGSNPACEVRGSG